MAAPMKQRAPALILSILKTKEEDSTLNDSLVLETIVQSTCELLLFKQDGSSYNDLVGYINKCLGASSTRVVGLALLGPLLAQASAQQFQQHCLSWLRLLTQIIQPYSHLSHLKLCSSLVNQLLSKASSYPDVSREVSSKLIHPMVDKALHLKDERLLFGLEVLESCIKFYPGPCGPMRNQLVNHFMFILGNSHTHHVAESAGKCFAMLPSIGGGGVGGVLHQVAWTFYMKKLFNTVEHLFSKLYKDQDTDFENPTSEDCSVIPLPEPASDEPEQTLTLAKQSQRILHTMRAMLENRFPVLVIIPHRDILTMICNILAVTGRALTLNGSTQSYYLLMVLTGVHEAALKLLNAVILRCSNHLLPNGKVINQLLLQVLNWTALCESETSLNSLKFRGIKYQVYETCHTWLNEVCASAYMGENTVKLISHIMNDAYLREHPQQESNLKEPIIGDHSGPRKKKQKKHHQWKVEPVGVSIHESSKQLEDLCVAALRVLKRLFYTCGSRLKWTIHRDIHSAVTRVLLECQAGLRLSSPTFQSALCRKELYHVLLACVLSPCPSWSVPLHCSICIFSQGRLDSNSEVKGFCTEATAVCENLIHPRVLQIPNPFIPQEETKEKSGANSLPPPSFLFPSLGDSNMNFIQIPEKLKIVQDISNHVEKSLHSDITTKEGDDQTRMTEIVDTSSINRVRDDDVKESEIVEEDGDLESESEQGDASEEMAVDNDGEREDGVNTVVTELPSVSSKMYDEDESVALKEKDKPEESEIIATSENQDSKGSIGDMLASFSTEGPDTED